MGLQFFYDPPTISLVGGFVGEYQRQKHCKLMVTGDIHKSHFYVPESGEGVAYEITAPHRLNPYCLDDQRTKRGIVSC